MEMCLDCEGVQDNVLEEWLVCQKKYDGTNALEVEYISDSKDEAVNWAKATKKIHGGIYYIINSTTIY